MSADEYRAYQLSTANDYADIGMSLVKDDATGGFQVISVYPSSPAAMAGLGSGMIITAVDGQTLNGFSTDEVRTLIRSKLNTKFVLEIGNGQGNIEVDCSNVNSGSVNFRMEKTGAAYIQIHNFEAGSGQSAVDAIEYLLGQGADSLVIDVRNNPGGLLDQAVSVADLFLNEGEIVSTRPRRTEEMQRYNATKGDITKNKPIVVLINEGSASAAEIVSGALQDHKRAVIVGMRSFGKGSVQTVIPVTGFGAIRLTTARYYTPSGRSIQAKGIEPDIEIPPGHVEYYALRSDDFAEATLPNALAKQDEDKTNNSKNKTGKDKKLKKDKKVKNKTEKEPDPFDEKPKEEQKKEDYQLDRAIDIVKAMGIYQSR